MEENRGTSSKTSGSDPNGLGKRATKSRFPVVGIGASAGGLEALRAFLTNVPANSGMAFIIIQHMDPKRKDLLVNILQDSTTMKVVVPRHIKIGTNAKLKEGKKRVIRQAIIGAAR